MYSFDKLCSNVIPTGKYKVQVTDIKFKMGATGEATKDILVTYTIVEGPQAKKVFSDTIYEKAFGFRLMPFLTACKVDTAREFSTAEELFKYGLKEAKGKILMLDITIKPYNGKDYNNVSDFSPLPDSTVTADDVLGELKVNPTVSGAKAAAIEPEGVDDVVNAEPKVDFEDDDLPF
jgi:hypothetical protein